MNDLLMRRRLMTSTTQLPPLSIPTTADYWEDGLTSLNAKGNYSLTDERLRLSCPARTSIYYRNASCVTIVPYDVTGRSRLYLEYMTNVANDSWMKVLVSDYVPFRAETGGTELFCATASTADVHLPVEIDISGISGEKYIAVTLHQYPRNGVQTPYTYCEVKNISLE